MAAYLMGGKKVTLDKMKFTSSGSSKEPVNGLFIDEGSELEVSSLELEDALFLINRIKLF